VKLLVDGGLDVLVPGIGAISMWFRRSLLFVSTCHDVRLIAPSCSSSDSDSGSVHSRGRIHGSRTVAKQRQWRQWRQRMQWLQWQLLPTIAPHRYRCISGVFISFCVLLMMCLFGWPAGRLT